MVDGRSPLASAGLRSALLPVIDPPGYGRRAAL